MYIPEIDLISIAISSLGLDNISDFSINSKIIEKSINDTSKHLSSKTIFNFTDELSRNTAAPGGGSVSALAGSLSSSLISMVCNISLDSKTYTDREKELNDIAILMQAYKDELNNLVDKDTKAFQKIIFAIRMPKKSDEDITKRDIAIQDATKEAIDTPFNILLICKKIINECTFLLSNSNPNCLSDLGVALLNIKSASLGALYNISINLKDVNNKNYIKDTISKSMTIYNDILDKYDCLITQINSSLGIHDDIKN